MSTSHLPSDVLNKVVSFLPQENAHACAGVCKQLNQFVHMGAFARMQIERLFPDQNSSSPIAEYQKLVHIFANFAAGRCSYSTIDALPRDAISQPSLSLGAFRLLPHAVDRRGDTYVVVERHGGIIGRLQIWNSELYPNPGRLQLYPTSGAGGLIVSQTYWGYYGEHTPKSNTMYKRLDFSLAQEEILFDLADRLFTQPDKDAPDVDPWHNRFKNSLSHQDKNAIYRELYLLNSNEGNQHLEYGRMAFEVEGPGFKRSYFVPNKDRGEAILHYSMRLIARRYAAPHGDPLAETLFNRLPVALRNRVYGELWAIKRPQGGEDVWNYGELAFHGRLDTVTNLERRAVILNFVDRAQKVM